MELGFDTIGNATLVVHDDGPLLVTDPWVRGGAYFGSWGLSHEIPAEQLAASRECPDAYFKSYRRRAPLDYIRHHFEERSKKAVRGALRDDSPLYRAAKRVYWGLRAA